MDCETARTPPTAALGRGRSARPRGVRPAAWAIAAIAALAGRPTPAPAQDKLAVPIVYVTREEGAKLPPLSLLEPRELPDEGLAGATLGLKDNQTTGGFLGHDYTLSELVVPEDGDLAAAVQELLAAGERFFVADLPQEDLLALADLPEAADAIIFNGRAQDDVLRTDDCRPNVFHTIPSRAMKADALAQFLVWKRWDRWFLIQGERPADLAFADALRRSAAQVQRQDRRGAHLRLRADRARDRDRPRPGAAADAGLHPGRARARRPAGRRRERRVRRVPALPDLGPASGRRHPGSGADRLASRARAVGRHPDAEPLRGPRRPLDARARLYRLARRCARSARR